MDEGDGVTLEAVKELCRATDLALRATKHTTRAVGRSMAGLVTAELWLNLTEIREKEKAFLLDFPISGSGLFGDAVNAKKVPQVRLRGKGLPLQGSSLWASSGPKDVHQVYGCSSGPAEAPGHLNPQLPGRLAYFNQLQGAGDSSQGLCPFPSSRALGLRLNGQKSVLTTVQQTIFLESAFT